MYDRINQKTRINIGEMSGIKKPPSANVDRKGEGG
jgi:hypothetical protein